MRNALLSIATTLVAIVCIAQSNNKAAIIRALDQHNAATLVKKDTLELMQYLAKDFLLNPPGGKVSFGADRIVSGIRAGFIYVKFDVVTDTVYFINNRTAISMGSETAVQVSQGQTTGATVKRGYTNIWVRQKGKWLLKARHSSILCSG